MHITQVYIKGTYSHLTGSDCAKNRLTWNIIFTYFLQAYSLEICVNVNLITPQQSNDYQLSI